MCCLWDTSNKIFGDMNYYNRETNKWYDEKIQNIFLQISSGNSIRSSDFYINTKLDIRLSPNYYGDYFIDVRNNLKPLKIILNSKNIGELTYSFSVVCVNKNG